MIDWENKHIQQALKMPNTASDSLMHTNLNLKYMCVHIKAGCDLLGEEYYYDGLTAGGTT